MTYLGRDPINTKDLDDAINQAFTSGNFPNAEIDQSFTSHQELFFDVSTTPQTTDFTPTTEMTTQERTGISLTSTTEKQTVEQHRLQTQTPHYNTPLKSRLL